MGSEQYWREIANLHGAIGAAQSIGHACAQAREMLAIPLFDEPYIMQTSAVDGIDPNVVKLVKPR